MESLLRNDFTAHYGLPVATVTDLSLNTNAPYFEIEDDSHRETQLHFMVGSGMANYQNANSYDVRIINYDKFLTSMPRNFQHGKDRCDLIVYTTNQRYFLLNELKDRVPRRKVRRKAKDQLRDSLALILAVPTISAFANSHFNRHCCFFNKQSVAPLNITAPKAFNRLSTITNDGLKMSDIVIESLGFEFWEYSGNQVCKLYF